MTEAAEKLKPVLAALSPSDRAELTRFLTDLPDAEPADEWDDEFLDEMDRRLADMRSGKDPGASLDELFAGLDEKPA